MSTGKFSIWLFVAAVIVLPVTVYGVVKWYERKFHGLQVFGEKGHTISDFNMINQDGEKRTIANWEGKIVVANFFFTHCPVVCPKMTKNLKKVQEAYKGDKEILINSFTVDPERDEPKTMKMFADRYEVTEGWDFLTGDKKELYRLARKSFLIAASDGDGGPDDFIHSEMLVLVDKNKRIRGFYKGTDESQADLLINDIKKLKHEN